MLERHPNEETRRLEGKFLQQRFVDMLLARDLDPEKALPAELLVTGGMVNGVMMSGEAVCDAITKAGNVASHMDALNLRVSLINSTTELSVFMSALWAALSMWTEACNIVFNGTLQSSH